MAMAMVSKLLGHGTRELGTLRALLDPDHWLISFPDGKGKNVPG